MLRRPFHCISSNIKEKEEEKQQERGVREIIEDIRVNTAKPLAKLAEMLLLVCIRAQRLCAADQHGSHRRLKEFSKRISNTTIFLSHVSQSNLTQTI